MAVETEASSSGLPVVLELLSTPDDALTGEVSDDSPKEEVCGSSRIVTGDDVVGELKMKLTSTDVGHRKSVDVTDCEATLEIVDVIGTVVTVRSNVAGAENSSDVVALLTTVVLKVFKPSV